MLTLKILFWASLFLLLHTYFFYPILLKLLSYRKKNNEITFNQGELPLVSIIIPAFNEEKMIGDKIESILKSNYPIDKIEILVGSDASTDNTNNIVLEFSKKNSNVYLHDFESRTGKIAILNQLKQKAKHDILILTDANVIFDISTIHELIKHFKNSDISLVDSVMINLDLKKDGISRAENSYIKGEVVVKNNEGKLWGMMMGPFGGCYAIRKTNYVTIPENVLIADDFFLNMHILAQGKKSISEINAKAFEKIPDDWKIELHRKIRISAGSFQNLSIFYPLLFKINRLSFCFFSHKVLRWLGPALIFCLYSTSFSLSHITPESSLYHLLFIFQSFILLLLPLDLLLKAAGINFIFTRIITHFTLTNLSLVLGFIKFIFGTKNSIWQPTKR